MSKAKSTSNIDDIEFDTKEEEALAMQGLDEENNNNNDNSKEDIKEKKKPVSNAKWKKSYSKNILLSHINKSDNCICNDFYITKDCDYMHFFFKNEEYAKNFKNGLITLSISNKGKEVRDWGTSIKFKTLIDKTKDSPGKQEIDQLVKLTKEQNFGFTEEVVNDIDKCFNIKRKKNEVKKLLGLKLEKTIIPKLTEICFDQIINNKQALIEAVSEELPATLRAEVASRLFDKCQNLQDKGNGNGL